MASIIKPQIGQLYEEAKLRKPSGRKHVYKRIGRHIVILEIKDSMACAMYIDTQQPHYISYRSELFFDSLPISQRFSAVGSTNWVLVK